MCGIAGVVETGERFSADQLLSVVGSMTDRLAHRGPDGKGFTKALATGSGGYLVLGHRRLSIVDIDGGSQPMACPQGKVFLTFNGEIYNFPALRLQLSELGFVFQTHSDTEVVLAAYLHFGASCVAKFNGMFALAIWDSEKQQLFVARDSFGKKPFFYRHDEQGFQFASEIKAFAGMQHSPALTVNTEALSDCTLLRYMPGEQTLFEGIMKLEPGCWAVYNPANNTLDTTRYYQHPDSLPRTNDLSTDTTAAPLHEQFLTLLDDSVSSRLNVDVPFGAFLSGGIDSTVVVALMTRHMSTPVKTFSIGFGQKDLSELDSAKLVADTFGTDHHEKVIEPEDFIRYLPEAIYYRDGPVSEPSDVPILLLSRLASEQVKMVLTGEGSDEVLGGYPKHAVERYSAYTAYIPRGVKKMLRSSIRTHLPAKHEKIKCALNSLLADDTSDRLQRWFGSTDLEIRNQLHEAREQQHASAPQAQRFEFEGGTALRNILAFDQSVWLPNNLLERGDRMTMAASLEARMPFLDIRLAKFVSQLPDSYRVRGKKTKWILREAAAEIIPATIIQRKKLGFKVPIEEWFRTSLAAFVHDYIVAPGACIHEFMAEDVIRRLYKDHLDRKQNHEKILWSLLNMEIWMRQTNGLEEGRPSNTMFETDNVSNAS